MCLKPAHWLALTLLATAAVAQAQVQATPQNVVNLNVEASLELPQDLLAVTLSVTREGVEPATVQAQLRQALDSALAEARKAVRAGQLDLRTGAFSVSPRYAAKPTPGGNNITGWLGRAELVIEGKDIAAISQLAGRLSTLQVVRTVFGLSREAREKVEAEVAAQAISRFRARAQAYAQHFGFGSYVLREVAVGGGEVGAPVQRARLMGAASAEESQPVEAGKAVVSVTVSGSIQLSLP